MPVVIEAISLILDNDSIHSSNAVKSALVTDLACIRLCLVLPYCPTDHRIERAWLDLHAAVTATTPIPPATT